MYSHEPMYTRNSKYTAGGLVALGASTTGNVGCNDAGVLWPGVCGRAGREAWRVSRERAICRDTPRPPAINRRLPPARAARYRYLLLKNSMDIHISLIFINNRKQASCVLFRRVVLEAQLAGKRRY